MRYYLNIFKIGLPAIALVESNILSDELSARNVYSTVCRYFVKSVGKNTLKAVPSLDEKDNVKPFQLVIKSKKRTFIFFEKDVYRPTEFQISDIMTDKASMTTKLFRSTLVSNYHRSAKLSLKGEMGVDMSKQFIFSNAEMMASNMVTLDIKLGRVTKSEVDDPELVAELKNRYIDLNHPYIQQIREDDTKVVCMITGVAALENGGSVHRETDRDASTKLGVRYLKNANISGEASYNRNRDITFPANTPVAYNVCELKIDTDTGAIQLVLARGLEGGFKDDADDADADDSERNAELRSRGKLVSNLRIDDRGNLNLDLRHPRDIFLPLSQLPTQQRKEITEDLLYLLSVPRDIYILADIIEQAEANTLSQLRLSELEDKLLSPRERWTRLFRISGFTIENDLVLPPTKSNPLLKCVGEFLDAVTVLDDDDIELLRLCSRNLAEPLFTVFQQGIMGRDVIDPSVVQPLLRDSVARKLLQQLQFQLHHNKILAPINLPFSFDEVYWILYALWGKD